MIRKGHFLAVAIVAFASPAWGRGYVMSSHWPSGIFDRQLPMIPDDAPLCRAMTKAVNRIAAHKPIAMCRRPLLASDGVVEALWEPVHVDDPLALFMRFQKTMVPNAVFDDADIADAKARLSDGRYRFETATVSNMQPLSGEVRLLRLAPDDCAKPGTAPAMALVVADDAVFTTLRNIVGGADLGSVLTFKGRAYILEMERLFFDDDSVKRLKPPQHAIELDETMETFDGRIAAVKVCRLRFR